MISASFVMKLCGFFYIFILATNAASVGLGNRIDETDSVSKFLAILEDPDRYRRSVFVALGSHLGARANRRDMKIFRQNRQRSIGFRLAVPQEVLFRN